MQVVKMIDEAEILSRFKSQISGSLDDIIEEEALSEDHADEKDSYFDLNSGDPASSPKKRKNSADNA